MSPIPILASAAHRNRPSPAPPAPPASPPTPRTLAPELSAKAQVDWARIVRLRIARLFCPARALTTSHSAPRSESISPFAHGHPKIENSAAAGKFPVEFEEA